MDTVGAGERPPVAKPPVQFSNGLPPTHPQYWHVKALMTAAEYIARYANVDSASLIKRVLNLPDPDSLPKEMRVEVKKAVSRMQQTRDPELVVSLLADLEAKGIDTIDPLGPAFFRAGKARFYENAISAADKMGPLGGPVREMARLFFTPIHLNRQIPSRDADDHIRNLGMSFKMGNKRMTSADMESLRSFEQRMWDADSNLARDRVLTDFEQTVKKNMQAEGKWDAYKKFERRILDNRAFWVKSNFGEIKREAYGRESSVNPGMRQVYAEMDGYLKKSAEYEAAGDAGKAALYSALADGVQTRLDQTRAAGHIYTDALKNPGKYRKKNELRDERLLQGRHQHAPHSR
jgi:hypothetical protein